LESHGAVALFANRARQVRPDFSLAEEAEAVVQICHQTEGLPLALELAASWVRTLSCGEIAAEIQANLDFLTSRLQDVPPQHQSMRAVFRQSLGRLPPERQATFARLSVFRDGFERAPAEQIAEASLAVLSALVDSSLVRRDGDGRYRMHELLRQYGAEKLAQVAEEQEAVRATHARYYLRFLEERTEALRGGRQVEALTEIEAERENVRLAWDWAVNRRETERIAAAAEPLNLFYDIRGRYMEGIRAFDAAREALTVPEPPAEAQRALALIYVFLGGLYLRVGQLEEAEHHLEQGQRLFQQLEMTPPPGYVTDPKLGLGFLMTVRGQFDRASQLGRESLASAEKENHLLNQQVAHYLLARAALLQGKLAEARAHTQQSYALTRATGDRWFMAYCLNELGYMAFRAGDYRAARQHYVTSYKIRREFQDPEGMALALGYLGAIARQEGQYEEAERLCGESLTISQEIGNRGSEALALQGLARTAIARDDLAEGGRLLRQALRPAREGEFVSLFLSLLVDVARFFQRRGDSQQIGSLLALVMAHPGTEPEAREEAQALWEEAVEEDEAAITPALAPDAGWPALEQLLLSLQAELELAAGEPAGVIQPEAAGERKNVDATGAEVLVEPLTEREAEVLALMAEGHSNPEIAEQLTLAVGTVKFYTSAIYGKLGVKNRVAAVRQAQELGLLDG
jgi:DNA-binding CsgD family transcriptional regulator